MSEELENRIQAYLEGRMDPGQRNAFEEEIKQHPELAQEITDLQQLDQGLQALGLEAFQKEVKSWESQHKKSTTFSWRPLAIAAALLLLLLPAIYFFLTPANTSQELFEAYYEPYEELVLTRGNDDSLATTGVTYLTEGLEAYNLGAYQLAADNLSEYLRMNPDEHRVALYLAIAQLELNLQDEAAQNFSRAQQDQTFRQQALWYQALSYLKFDQPQKAADLLSQIANDNTHYRRESAAQLLKELTP